MTRIASISFFAVLAFAACMPLPPAMSETTSETSTGADESVSSTFVATTSDATSPTTSTEAMTTTSNCAFPCTDDTTSTGDTTSSTTTTTTTGDDASSTSDAEASSTTGGECLAPTGVGDPWGACTAEGACNDANTFCIHTPKGSVCLPACMGPECPMPLCAGGQCLADGACALPCDVDEDCAVMPNGICDDAGSLIRFCVVP